MILKGFSMKNNRSAERPAASTLSLDRNPGWASSIAWVSLLFLFWLATFYPVYPELIANWLGHSNNSHGVLVPFISFFLIWQKREDLRRIEKNGAATGLWILCASLILYLFGYTGSVAVLTRSMIVTSLIGIVIYNWGWMAFRIIAFPLVFLFFMVPVPDSIYGYFAFPLQLFATKAATALIKFTSIPVFREGNMLYFAQTQLEVAEACSGLRSMVSYLMLSVLFAYMMSSGWSRRIVLVLSAIPLAILVNIIRVTGTGILAHFWGGAVARGFLHEFSGIVVFVLGLFMLAVEYSLLRRRNDHVS